MESQKKPTRTVSLKAMFVVVALCAILLFWMAPATLSLRCDYGSGDWLGGILVPGDVVDVIAETSTGKFETVATRVTIVGEPKLEFHGNWIYFITIKTSLIKKWRIGGYSSYMVVLSVVLW
jgi:hypothetical protein